ncbi:Protein spindle-F [Eumeta japonica]|uniref:Protein spindle-F n=1 Tax=Eumeta variegata TaxID=151549 RepID=A0A4C1Z127_EUMVA|nr:Protein spindle-F [Eumeta japonica]
MRDRCLLLQRRITALENDNMKLKLESTKTTDFSASCTSTQDDERRQLQQKIAELSKQKSQLLHHVFMVTCENKSLWAKISNLKKVNVPDDEHSKSSKHTPLIRTNTYIQSSPRRDAAQDKFSESSLEEISLKLINSYIQEKSQLVEQYEQMTQLQDAEDDILNTDSIGFAYIEEPATDSLKEIHCQTEKLHNLKKDLSQQEQDIKEIIMRLEAVAKDGYKCPTCLIQNQKVVSSQHKEIETSDSLANWATPTDSTNYNEDFSDMNTSALKKGTTELQDKNSDDKFSKMCPMCGEWFNKDTEFSEFQMHVEKHFIGEPDLDSIVGNFENIARAGDNLM